VSGSVAQLARAVATGELRPDELVSATLERIEQRADLNALITICAGQALARARAGVEGPLVGVPLLVKDVFDTAGVRATAGSRLYADRVPHSTAPVVHALEAAGAIVIGKTNCDEFAWGVTGQNEFYGDVRNPSHPGRITGGSSSGNAAALAADLVPLAIGSDTGGSVRMPAGCCCNVVGMKPRVGVVPTDGLFPLCPSFDTVGPMARTVEDCALCYEVLAGARLPDRAVDSLRVGVLTAMPPLGPDEPRSDRDERALAFATRLEELGMRAEEVSLPVPEADIWPVFYGEAAATHRDTFPARREEYGSIVRAKLERAVGADPTAFRAGRGALEAWRAQSQSLPAVDLIVCPTLGVHEIPPADVDELEIRVAFSAYTRAFSFLGWPAIAIGGVQFGARDEAVLFAAALAWERAYGPPD
jgi:Asp-tRNA(Asn)/Glu-tRNA(Gln) amidotransferase A subunit family amidase